MHRIVVPAPAYDSHRPAPLVCGSGFLIAKLDDRLGGELEPNDSDPVSKCAVRRFVG